MVMNNKKITLIIVLVVACYIYQGMASFPQAEWEKLVSIPSETMFKLLDEAAERQYGPAGRNQSNPVMFFCLSEIFDMLKI